MFFAMFKADFDGKSCQTTTVRKTANTPPDFRPKRTFVTHLNIKMQFTCDYYNAKQKLRCQVIVNQSQSC